MTARAADEVRVMASPVHTVVHGTTAAVPSPRADGVASSAHLGQADDAVRATAPAPRTAFVLLCLDDAMVAGCAAPGHRITGRRFRSTCRRWRIWRRRCAARSRPKWSCHAAHSSGASDGRSRQVGPARVLFGGRSPTSVLPLMPLRAPPRRDVHAVRRQLPLALSLNVAVGLGTDVHACRVGFPLHRPCALLAALSRTPCTRRSV